MQLPAGLCDVAGEDAAVVARRELVEEAGLAATELDTPGLDVLLAGHLPGDGALLPGHADSPRSGRGDFEPEHEEAEMETGWVPVAELHDAVLAGRVRDAHLAIALLTAHARGLVG